MLLDFKLYFQLKTVKFFGWRKTYCLWVRNETIQAKEPTRSFSIFDSGKKINEEFFFMLISFYQLLFQTWLVFRKCKNPKTNSKFSCPFRILIRFENGGILQANTWNTQSANHVINPEKFIPSKNLPTVKMACHHCS